MNGGIALLIGVLVVVGVGAGIAGVAALVGRARKRRNRVVPELATEAPLSWAGAHTPLARLHRRLRAAVEAARGVPDRDGALLRARVEVEQAAVAVDDHLIALHHQAERERAERMAEATAAVEAVEEAAALLADVVSASRSTTLPAVEQALERAQLVAEARRELEEDDPAAILGEPRDVDAGSDDEDEGPQPRPSTG